MSWSNTKIRIGLLELAKGYGTSGFGLVMETETGRHAKDLERLFELQQRPVGKPIKEI